MPRSVVLTYSLQECKVVSFKDYINFGKLIFSPLCKWFIISLCCQLKHWFVTGTVAISRHDVIV